MTGQQKGSKLGNEPVFASLLCDADVFVAQREHERAVEAARVKPRSLWFDVDEDDVFMDEV